MFTGGGGGVELEGVYLFAVWLEVIAVFAYVEERVCWVGVHSLSLGVSGCHFLGVGEGDGREGVHCKVDVGVDDDKSLVFMTGLCFCEIWFLTLSVCL